MPWVLSDVIPNGFVAAGCFGRWTRLSKLTKPAADPKNDWAVLFS